MALHFTGLARHRFTTFVAKEGRSDQKGGGIQGAIWETCMAGQERKRQEISGQGIWLLQVQSKMLGVTCSASRRTKL